MRHWYLVHTKPRQEQVAMDNLQRQGFECLLPLIRMEKLRRGKLQVMQEALFPRYLFTRLGTDCQSQSWAPIRSTLGVSRLVTFGLTPARLDDNLVADIRARSESSEVRQRHFSAGEAVKITQGPFAGLDAIYQATDGEGRVMLLLEILSKQVRMTADPATVEKLV